MQFGMPTLIENKTLEENLALCRRLSLNFVELNMNFPEYQLSCLENTEPLITAAEKYGVYYTIHLDENLNPADFNPLVSDAYFETVRRTIEAAKRLVPLKNRFGDAAQPLTLNMHMHHGVVITLPNRKTALYARDFDTYMAKMQSFFKACEAWIDGADIRISIENTDTFRDYEKNAIECALKSPCFSLTWDIGHSKACGETDMPFILEHEAHLSHFHIHDGTEKPPKNHLALGTGEIDLKARLTLAKSRNARSVLETKTVAALTDSVNWLKTHDLF